MKLNFFTPLPPLKTDIAQCVARSLKPLCERFDLTLWTDQPEVDSSITSMAKVRHFSPDNLYMPALNYADFNLYNVGNDPAYHASIMDVALRVPGVVILHDACVHELMLGCLRRGPVADEKYLELLGQVSESALSDGKAVVEGRVVLQQISAKYPMTAWALQGALGVVTHNGGALHSAMPVLKLPVLETPLPWLPRVKIPNPVRRARGKGRLEMVICGYLNSPNRRLNETLEALASYPRRDEILLHIAGHVKDRKSLEARLRKLGLVRNVQLHGFLSEKELGGLLDRVHLAVNLRWPSMGEASGSQLRFWNHSLPSIVTRTGWYEVQPEGCLHYVNPESETADLHKHWNAALDDYESFAAAGLAGRKVLEERHGAESFAEALEAFLPDVAEYRKTAFVPKLSERAGMAIGGIGLQSAALELTADSAARAVAGIAGIKMENA